MRWRGFVITVAALLLAFLLAVLVGDNAGPAKARPAPALPTRVPVGPRVEVASLRGRPAIIHFWASWCGPCIKEAPQLARLASELHGRATLVGVDWSDSPRVRHELCPPAPLDVSRADRLLRGSG